MSDAVDPHSAYRPGQPRVTHLLLDLTIDFERRVLSGTAALHLQRAAESQGGELDELWLDTRDLDLISVHDDAGRSLHYEWLPSHPTTGSALRIQLQPATQTVSIRYETSPAATALQWLDPAQTAGKQHPFLFTQGHAIETRSWIPIQDSPGIRLTYEARISLPVGLVAVMAAEQLGSEQDGTSRVYSFSMPEPVPAYLIALAAGSLAMRELGPRTGVFAEPELIERAAEEFAELERMVSAAESLLGPYGWGRFDVLLMPPSFPYGGMENPRLTFASPSILAGDRSLTTVIAHELAHAWAGNLVVNACWNDFWINEGTTVYVELRLNELLWGQERAAILQNSGYRELQQTIDRMGTAHPDTRLCYDLSERNPAEGVTVVPYLKGAAFFWALESLVGRARLDEWLRGWFARQAFKSVTSGQLAEDLRAHLLTTAEDALFGMQQWLSAPGMPQPPVRLARSAILEQVEQASQAVLAGGSLETVCAAQWPVHAWRYFLGSLLVGEPDRAWVAALDAKLGLAESQNAELLLPWLRLAVATGFPGSEPRIEAFLRTHGRLKFLKPLYADLIGSAWGRPVAERVFATARPGYHPLVQAALDKLFLEPAK